MKLSKEVLYQNIAKACLQAINQTTQGKLDMNTASKQVYNAIDLAFQEQHKLLLDEYQRLQQALTAIAELPPGGNSKALKIAQNALNTDTH